MAFIDDQHDPNFKHYCRVCKKGFMCGRALGGHMRAHGIGDESCNLEEEDDDDPMSDWEDKFGGANKKMYQLRTNPNRLKSCRTCENCGKEFVSWKSFLEHGKCNSDDASESLISSPNSDESGAGAQGNRWSKRKRSARSNVGCSFSSSYPPEEDDDILLAKCLVQLANTVVEFPSDESYSDEERRMPNSYFAPLIKSGTIAFDHKEKGVSKGMFECKACKKVFNSHQALGGHRASHKKVKGCYAAKQDHEENNSALAIEDDAINIPNNNNEELLVPPPKPTSSLFQFEQGHALVGHVARRKAKVHECSICHRVFASGQALGGHKRCHWITSNAQETSKFHFQDINNVNETNNHNKQTSDKLDLNVPAWAHASGLMRGPPATLTLNVSTDMQLHSGPRCLPGDFHLKKGDDRDSNNVSAATRCAEDEADSNKLIKLSELKEMDNSGSSSQWLQVGIGSTAKADTDV